jgi:ABC-type Fe3+ transport system substrate-binding protein
MVKRAFILLALAAVVALPFAFRPHRSLPGRTDDTVVIVTPHNEAIRYEFGRGFAGWYHAKTGRTVAIDWRVIGGTSDIARYLESAYSGAFEYEWARQQHHAWDDEVQAGFQNAKLPPEAGPAVRAARNAFLASNVGCGIDVFFGGDTYEYGKEAAAGRLVDCGLRRLHPEWFRDAVIPQQHGGEPLWDPAGRWFGVVLSSYGVIFDRDSCARLGVGEPKQWTSLTDPRLVGEVGLADPTKSGSVCEAFEAILQQQMQRRMDAAPSVGRRDDASTHEAIRAGWIDGLRLIQQMGANARYFTDSSQKPPIDVAQGDCAAGLCIDFYGRQQQEAVRRRGDSRRIGYITPKGGSAASADPIGLLRGAPHHDVAVAFIEYALSPEGQRLWALRPGTPGGPERYALRRMPIRRDFYTDQSLAPLRSDPEDAPYDADRAFVYHAAWTGNLFREIGFVTRVMCQDTHVELVAAWRSINAAAEPARSRALAVLQDVSRVDYDRTSGEIHRRLNAPDGVEEVRLATELSAWFRANYRKARDIAEEGGKSQSLKGPNPK